MSQSPQEPVDVQRALMDRAQRLAERDRLPYGQPLLPRLLGLGLALVVVVVVLFAFDRFLASMQRFLALPITDPEPAVTTPLPVYVVPADEGALRDVVQPADEPGPAQQKATEVASPGAAPQS